jgi:PUA-domain protein
MRKSQISKSDQKKMNQELMEKYSFDEFFTKKDKCEKVIFDDLELISKNDEYVFFFYEGIIIPTIKFLMNNNFLKKVTVDMGAIPFITKGADIMRPGIVDFDENIKKDDIISIIDVNHKKIIAIGKMLVSFDDLKNMKLGKVIKNIHRIGDNIWYLK